MIKFLKFLSEHSDLIEEIIRAIAAGAPKAAIKAAIRAVKVEVSDRAIKDELGIDD